MENTSNELQETAIELLEHLFIIKKIDKATYEYLLPYLTITTYKFNTLRMFKEMLYILANKAIDFSEYNHLYSKFLQHLVIVDIDTSYFQGEDLKFVEYYNKNKFIPPFTV